MTPDEIKERCEQFCKDYPTLSFNDPIEGGMIPWATSADALESLYREALAKGLEMAREKIGRRIDYYSNTRWALPSVRALQINEATGCQQVCETLANTLKEPL